MKRDEQNKDVFAILEKAARKKIQLDMKLLGEYIDYEQKRGNENNWPSLLPIMKIENNKLGFMQGDGVFTDFDSIMNKTYLNG